MTPEQIQAEAMSGKGINEISQEAQYYRAYGKMPEVSVPQAPNPSGVNFTAGPVPASGVTNPVNPQVPPPSVPTDYAAILAGALSSLEDTSDEQARVDTAYQELLRRMQELEGQAGYQAEQEEKYGLEAKRKTVNDLTAQLTALQAEAASEQIQARARAQSGTFTTGGLQADMTQIEANRASRSLVLSAQLQAANGNLEMAVSQIERAIGLKYDPIRQQIENWKAIYEMNRDSLTAAEKKRADQLKMAYDIYLRQLDKEEAEEKQVKSTLLNQMSQYPDAGITMNDTLESANAKIQKNSKIYQNQVRLVGGEGGGGTTSLFDGVMQAALDEGATSQEAALAAQAYADSVGISIPYKSLTDLVNRASTLKTTKKTGQPSTETIPTSKIEKNIADLRTIKGFTDENIRKTLKQKGYTDTEIANSSVGSYFGITANKFLVGIQSLLFNR